MSNRKAPDPDAPIVDPSIFRKFYRNVSERVFLLFERSEFEMFVKSGGYSQRRKRRIGSSEYIAGHGRGDYGMAGPVIGAPAAVIALEFLIALGAREVICFGSCGSIDPRFRIGDTVVPIEAISEEGTSSLYVPDADQFSASNDLCDRLISTFRNKGVEVKNASCWTTDAFFRETPAKVQAFRDRGASVVDMESSALFAVAAFRRIELGSLFVISDELFDGKWKPGFLLPRFKLARRRSLKILQSLRNL